MSHLRLVAGTDVTGPALKKTRAAAKKRAVQPEVDTKTLENQARVMIYGLVSTLEGKSVEALFAEFNRILDGGYLPFMEGSRRAIEIKRALYSMGIRTHSAAAYEDLDVHAFGIVLDWKHLLKVCPALKPYAQALDGLML
ncbi:hypothetical protein GO300_03815 [Ralstonia solanacearum]|nr:hypothetical protein [Ralstonia solanacearum]